MFLVAVATAPESMLLSDILDPTMLVLFYCRFDELLDIRLSHAYPKRQWCDHGILTPFGNSATTI